MGFLQLGNRQVKVPFRGGKAAMAEDLLNVAQVGFALQKMGGAGVPPKVTGHALFDPDSPGIFFDQAAEGVPGNGQPAQRQEEPLARSFSQQFRADAVDVAFQRD